MGFATLVCPTFACVYRHNTTEHHWDITQTPLGHCQYSDLGNNGRTDTFPVTEILDSKAGRCGEIQGLFFRVSDMHAGLGTLKNLADHISGIHMGLGLGYSRDTTPTYIYIYMYIYIYIYNAYRHQCIHA